ncbi:MAG TPA: hypothetical protein VF736_21905 [Pyrinomonadaceae bacterium]|jgi:hypothetical protein
MHPFALALALVLLLFAHAQDPLVAAPGSYSLAFENDRVRVTRVRYAPRGRVPVHDHPNLPTVFVYLSDSGPVRFVHEGEEGFTLVRPPVRAGGFRLSRGTKERHSVESLSDVASDFLRVELKGFTAAERQTFHGRFPPEPRAARRGGEKVRYEDTRVRIARVTCPSRARCDRLGAPGSPSLLVALTAATLKTAGGGTEVSLTPGQTMWSEPGAAPAFENAAARPAEFLRIDLKN